MHWGNFDQVTKRDLVFEWHRHARMQDRSGKQNFRGMVFLLPQLLDSEGEGNVEAEIFMICKNALCQLLNIGRRMLEKSKTGKTGHLSCRGKGNADMHDLVDEFFKQLEGEGVLC